MTAERYYNTKSDFASAYSLRIKLEALTEIFWSLLISLPSLLIRVWSYQLPFSSNMNNLLVHRDPCSSQGWFPCILQVLIQKIISLQNSSLHHSFPICHLHLVFSQYLSHMTFYGSFSCLLSASHYNISTTGDGALSILLTAYLMSFIVPCLINIVEWMSE